MKVDWENGPLPKWALDKFKEDLTDDPRAAIVAVLCGGPLDGLTVCVNGGTGIEIPVWTEEFRGWFYRWEWFADTEGPPYLATAVFDGVIPHRKV